MLGSIRIAGVNPGQIGVSAMAGIVGFVFQDFEAQLFSTRVDLELAFGLENSGLDRRDMRERVRRIGAAIGLQDWRAGSRPDSPVDRSNVWPSVRCWRRNHRSCAWMSRRPTGSGGENRIFALLRQLRVALTAVPAGRGNDRCD